MLHDLATLNTPSIPSTLSTPIIPSPLRKYYICQKKVGAIKKLLGQTAIYGMSSIVGRLLNYLLVPLYTYTLPTEEYGMVTELYSYVALLFALLLYGMETTFFRFSETQQDKKKVLSTASLSVLFSTTLFFLLFWLFRHPIAQSIGYENHEKFISWFILIISFDALTSIPFAYLRQQNKAMKFAGLKIVNIFINLGLNIFFIVYCKQVFEAGSSHPMFAFVSSIFSNEDLVQYIFISNLAASAITLLLLLPIYKHIRAGFSTEIWKKMMPYALPILVVNITGLIPISLDKILLPMLYSGTYEEGMQQLGIYGANSKIAVIMLLFIQTFRYAADPFFFAEAQNKNAKATYSRIMHWFVIFGSFIFISAMLFMDIIQYFVGKDYRDGLSVVPILLMANLILGIYYNLSFWYKLSDKTMFGAWFSVIGAIVAIGLNFLLVPYFGMWGSAWAVFAAYLIPTILSFYFMKKHYPIPYILSAIIFYPILVVFIYALSRYFEFGLLINAFIWIAFIAFVLLWEKKKKRKFIY